MPCLHRGVGGEDGARPAHLQGLVEGQAALHVLPDVLHPQEAGVALVGVEDLRLGVPGGGDSRPGRPVPRRCRAAAPGAAGGQCRRRRAGRSPPAASARSPPRRSPAAAAAPARPGQSRPAPTSSAPSARATGIRTGAPAVSRSRVSGRPLGVAGRVALGLPALGRQLMGEIAVPVQQADADERDAQVAGRLQVIAGQDAQPAGVLRQRRGDPVLRGEIGHRRLPARRPAVPWLGLLVPARPGQVIPQVIRGRHPASAGTAGSAASLVSRSCGTRASSPAGSPLGALPGPRRVNRREDRPGLGVPGPAQVEHQAAQRGQAAWAGRG